MYYHLTQRRWPQKITLYPRARGEHRPDGESKLPRICIGPTPAHCLIALGYTLDSVKPIYVYSTTENGIEAGCRVGDRKITGERWLVKPTQFVRLFVIKPNSLGDTKLFRLPVGATWCIRDQVQELREILLKLWV